MRLTLFQVGCAGAVLSYLLRRKSVEYLPGDDAAQMAFRVRTIEMFTLSDMMFINADTMASLQILQSEFHPNSHMQGPSSASSGAKESLSVFGLFHHLASTPQGKYKLRQIFLRPSLDLEVIEERQAAISILIRPENAPALEKMVKSLKKIKNIRAVVIHLQKGISGASKRGPAMQRGVWASLQQFTFHTLKIIEAITELVDGQDLMIVSKVNISKPDELPASLILPQCLETLQPFVLKQVGRWVTVR
jgi:DNA mismatch repair protein MSH5